jgi:hypothetical protein
MTQEIQLVLISGGIGLLGAIFGSSVGVLLNWRKEYLQEIKRKNDLQFEKLYGPVIYQLLMLKVIDINRKELIKEISGEPVPEQAEDMLKKWADVNPINEKWRLHIVCLKRLFEKNAGYIKKEHLKLVENLLDGLMKRDITKGGASIRTKKERIEKIFEAIDALSCELLENN